MKNAFLLCFLKLVGSAMAQTHFVTGFVRGSATNTPIQVATVKIESENMAVITATDRSFSS